MHQADSPPSAIARRLGAWVALVQRRAEWVLAAAIALGVALMWAVTHHLSVDTDNSHMLSGDLPWRQTQAQLDRLFPLPDRLVVVIDGDSADAVADAQRRLVEQLRTEPQRFASVFAAETEPYFRRSGLLYLDKEALQKLADQLQPAQPFLGTLARDPSPRGLFTLLDRALTAPPGAADFDLSAPLKRVAETVDAAAQGRSQPLSWQALLGESTSLGSGKRRFIQVDPVMDYGQLLPAKAPIERLRALGRELGIDAAHGLRLRLTGSAAMEHEEILTAFQGVGLALGVALLMVALLLWLALRSLRLMFASVVTLAYGLLATAAFAALAVGHLNLISVAFGVLYIGLGIDYALYLCMQYRENLGAGLTSRAAMTRAATQVGSFMLVCAATVALAFLAFVPTPFRGIAELGLISGAGMFVSLVASLTLLPAIVAILPPKAVGPVTAPPTRGGGVLDWPYRYRRGLWIGAAVLAAGALVLAPRQRFDPDPLNLRDQHSEAVSTYRELLHDPSVPTLTLSAIADDAASAQALAHRLGALPVASRSLSLPDFVPADQLDKLVLLSDLALNLSLPSPAEPQPPDEAAAQADEDALKQLRADLPAFQAAQSSDATRAAAAALEAALGAFAQHVGDMGPQARLAAWGQLQDALLGTLPQHLRDLVTALQAAPVNEASLPPALVKQWKSADGHYRVEVWPKEVLDTPAAVARFIDGVRAVAPQATGAPVTYVESGRAVSRAFQLAFVFSFVAIGSLLLVLLRSLLDTALVLVPLVLAGLYTVGSMVLLHLPFNFANVIALPLVLGVGVDYGVYLVQRARQAAAPDENLLRTGPARAVFYGALITIANFGNLMLAKHPGMVGMGLLLTLGLGMTLLCALVLLPSLIAWRLRRRAAVT